MENAQQRCSATPFTSSSTLDVPYSCRRCMSLAQGCSDPRLLAAHASDVA